MWRTRVSVDAVDRLRARTVQYSFHILDLAVLRATVYETKKISFVVLNNSLRLIDVTSEQGV